MKITSKNLLLISFFLFFVIAGLIVGLIFSTPDPQRDVSISHRRPASFDPVKSNQFNTAPNETISTTPTARETPLAVSIAEPTPLPPNQRMLAIQDPLDDPIPSGIVAFGSESLSFTHGRL